MISTTLVPHADRFFVGGEWIPPAGAADSAPVVDSGTEALLYRVPLASRGDMAAAAAVARRAFDDGPWPLLTHEERAGYLRDLAGRLRTKAAQVAEVWTRQSGVLHRIAATAAERAAGTFEFYADLATAYPFEAVVPPTAGGRYGVLVREPVGVVAAIVPWNSPLHLAVTKLAPALLAGCTAVLKPAPEAPGESYLLAEAAAEAGLPPGVLNVVVADREVSELLVRSPDIDKVAFTGSTAAGRRIGSICGERVARCTLELGGKSAAVVLDDIDLEIVADAIAGPACALSGQVCSSLSRVIVDRARHDALVEALVARLGAVTVGDPFEAGTHMGPLATERHRSRVEGYVAKGIEEGATVATGGGRPDGLATGWYVEPTVFAGVDNRSVVAQEEIFGPVLCVVPVDGEDAAVAAANDTIYGLNASVFTADVEHARAVGRRLRSGTVGHNGWRSDFGVSVGGFKQSGIGREGGIEGLQAYLETKYLVLDDVPAGAEVDA